MTVRGHWCGALTVWLTEIERSQYGRAEGSDRIEAGPSERIRPWTKLFEVLGEGGDEGTTVLRFREPVRLRGGRGAELYVRLHHPPLQASDEYFDDEFPLAMRGGYPITPISVDFPITSTISTPPPLPQIGWRGGWSHPGYRSPSVRQNIEREMIGNDPLAAVVARRGDLYMGEDTYNL